MCGVAGIISPEGVSPDPASLEAMARAIGLLEARKKARGIARGQARSAIAHLE